MMFYLVVYHVHRMMTKCINSFFPGKQHLISHLNGLKYNSWQTFTLLQSESLASPDFVNLVSGFQTVNLHAFSEDSHLKTYFFSTIAN